MTTLQIKITTAPNGENILVALIGDTWYSEFLLDKVAVIMYSNLPCREWPVHIEKNGREITH